MVMAMLEAGGLPIVTDGVRRADASNPNGYFEFEKVKALGQHGDTSWLADARGKAIKIVSFLLTYLPESHDYQVVFVHRDLHEVIASQHRMLDARGEPRGADDERTYALYAEHLKQIAMFLSRRRCFSTLSVDYAAIQADPDGQARRVNGFVGGGLDTGRMAGIVDPGLHRQRHRPATS